ncbi:pilus assembly PilX N-terminal domain-containing protein [Methylophilus sp. Leaf408]|uniref:pilus assembly PilX family protein n=1 Tax=Methylophilus sp. Leaf408 TaxID=2876561 RepID=UPI001E61D9C9|nr:pilus assembly PilX N-terminal domain-containing protein [Methylophilus sp. Leaf408]
MPYKSVKSVFDCRLAQAGIVLFFALLALAVMSIAAVALIRSVDTNALLSGNMVFRQSASAASNVALEGVAENIAKNISLANSVRHIPAQGYYANCSMFDMQPNASVCDGSRLTTMAWDDANSRLVPDQTDGNAEIRNGVDRQGNQIRYVIERMCNFNQAEINAGNAAMDAARCLMASATACEPPGNGGTAGDDRPCPNQATSPIYRLTLRISGPKNTLTYMQSFISN